MCKKPAGDVEREAFSFALTTIFKLGTGALFISVRHCKADFFTTIRAYLNMDFAIILEYTFSQFQDKNIRLTVRKKNIVT